MYGRQMSEGDKRSEGRWKGEKVRERRRGDERKSERRYVEGMHRR